jgi:hypothetical protein
VKQIVALLIAVSLAPASTLSQIFPRLEPVDEASRRPDFVTFRQQLRAAIARRDVPAVLRVVDPQIKLGFGGDDGVDALKRKLESTETDLWQELDEVLALGGTFQEPDTFFAPYVFSRWPETFDSFEHVAVIGSGVRIRARPALSAPVVATVSYAVLKLGPDGYSDEPWIGVRLPDGRAGFVDAKLARSPIDYRASFKFEDGRWRMVFFAAGD